MLTLHYLGEVYTCGKGGGILGHGDTSITKIPRRVEGLVVSVYLLMYN